MGEGAEEERPSDGQGEVTSTTAAPADSAAPAGKAQTDELLATPSSIASTESGTFFVTLEG